MSPPGRSSSVEDAANTPSSLQAKQYVHSPPHSSHSPYRFFVSTPIQLLPFNKLQSISQGALHIVILTYDLHPSVLLPCEEGCTPHALVTVHGFDDF